MKDINDYRLTDSVTVGDLRNWLRTKDDYAKNNMIELIDHRFTKRYIKHIASINSGFLKMAISCLTIETLESFKQGIDDTTGKSGAMFRDFFATEKIHFPGFDVISKDFYSNVRCGILHQAETTNAWRIMQVGPILDISEKTINAKEFVMALERSISAYINNLKIEDWNSPLWMNAIVKLEDICDNCAVKTP